MNSHDVGRRVRAAREKRSMDQAEVAELSGLSRAYVSRLESGGILNPKVFDLQAIATALRVPLDDLLYDARDVTDEDLRELEFLRRNSDVRMLFASFAHEYETLHEDDQKFLRGFLELVAKRRAERQEKDS